MPLFDEEEEMPVEEPFKIQNPAVREYLASKFSPEARAKLAQENEAGLGTGIAAGLAGLGSALSGGDALGATQGIVKAQQARRADALSNFDSGRKLAVEQDAASLDQERFARESDPSSEESKLAQELAVGMGLSKDLAGRLTAAKLKEQMPFLQKKFDIEQRRLDRQENASARAQEFALKRQDALEKRNEAASLGQKSVDRDFAKDYNEWTSGGSKNAQVEIEKLKNAAERLKKGETSTGALTGLMPDSLTSNDLLSVRSDINSTVMNSLRAILGAQFTEKEGERIIRNTWNEQDSTENNVARIERLVETLENQARDKDSKAKFYEQNATLAGFRGDLGRGKKRVKMIAPNGKPKLVDEDQVDAAIAAGGKLFDDKTKMAR